MKGSSIHSTGLLETRAGPRRLDRFARRIVLSRLQQLRYGQITLWEADNCQTFGTARSKSDLSAELKVTDPAFYSSIAFGGSIGAGESYMEGHWQCDDLTTLLRIMLQNRAVLSELDSGFARVLRPVARVLHWLNRNTRRGSRRNIAAHYDLGNDFYSLWLDPTMMYSSGYFESADTPLEAASTAKLERICRKLDLSADDAVIEIGTGWGGFAIYAASNFGCHVTTTTISSEQYAYARRRIEEAGLDGKITLLQDDYRDLEGKFDKLVSIEMIEAVGHQYHETFFRKCAELLKPDGQMLLQAITIADQEYERYKSGVDFIRRYIFPGGCLTSVTDMTRVMTRYTDLRVLHLEDIGPHYAQTLRAWHDRFLAKLDAVRAHGYSDTFIRMWRFYFCYCESAFIERAIGDVQMLMMRPRARRASIDY